MADEKQVVLLRRSPTKWNAWRKSHPRTKVDLRGADLSQAHLSGADLSDGDLSHALLTRAHLSRSDLRYATFTRSYLAGADFTSSDLKGTDLTHADLAYALFRRARLIGTDFTEARLERTLFIECDLTDAMGLTETVHVGPSSLDYDTLRRSRDLPVRFLRGCGIDDRFIEHLGSTLGAPNQFLSCFISYSTKDQSFADRIHADLQNAGVRCWFAPHDIQPGQKIHEQIDAAIRLHDRLLLILSDASMASAWVKTEIVHAREKERQLGRQVLFPIAVVSFERIRDWQQFNPNIGEDTAREIREYYIPDFSQWMEPHAYRAAFDRLCKALSAKPGV